MRESLYPEVCEQRLFKVRLSPADGGDARRFPVEDNVTESTYNYFISKLNFDAVSGKIVTGAA